jgi:hypothetical protein
MNFQYPYPTFPKIIHSAHHTLSAELALRVSLASWVCGPDVQLTASRDLDGSNP